MFRHEDGERVLRQHGDTVWSTTTKSAIRVIDRGYWISVMQTDQNGTVNSEWCVRGDRAYPSTDPNGSRSLSASSLRTIKSVVEAARRGDALLAGQKPPS